MKLEDLTQEALDELLQVKEASERSINGLKADIAKLKAKAKGADIDPEAHAELQTQIETLKGELDKVTKASKKTIDDLTGQVSAKDASLSKYLIDGQLSDSLAKAKIAPEFMDAVKAMHRGSATIKIENGEHVAYLGDKKLTDAVTEWSSSDAGKHFIKAEVNSGGGAGGGSGGSQKTGDLGGDKAARLAAINAKFPDLNKT